MEQIRENIYEATIEEFSEKGFKFTMDDIAKRLKMSKKTIYTVIKDKETLFLETADYVYSQIKASEQQVMEDDSLSTIEKLKKIMIVMPDRYKSMDWRQLFQLKTTYPKLYSEVRYRLETGWENTIELINRGVDEGVLRDVPIPVFKAMFEATLEKFLGTSILIKQNMSYEEAIEAVLDILMKGIEK